jgi:hypothetical protein
MIAVLSADQMAQLRALILVAMDRAGVGSKKPEMEQILSREDGVIVRKGTVDLGFVWRRLLILNIKEPEAAMVVAQMALYINQKLQAPMSLPTEVGGPVEGALERLGDPAGFMDELTQAVAALAPAQKEKIQQGATKSAERPKVALDLPVAKQEAAKAEPTKAKAEPAKARPEPPKPEPPKSEPSKSEPPRTSGKPGSRGRAVSSRALLVAALVAVLLVGGGLTLATQSDQAVPADAPLPRGQIAAVIPLKDVSVKSGVLQITASGKEFDGLDAGAQQAKAVELFSLLKGRNVMVIELKTPENEFKILKNEGGGAMVLRVEPNDEEAPPEEAPPQP